MVRFVAYLALAVFSGVAHAQTATITGRITDPGGGVVPDASITAQSASSGVSTSTRSNNEGYYSIPALLPGRYDVTVNKTGFSQIKQTGLVLEVQQVARLDFALQVGAVAETVQVTASAVMLQSETATLGHVVQSKQITELPLLGRNPYALALLVPGVRPSLGVNNLPIDQISTVSFAINGQRAGANEFLLDGAPNTASSQNQPVINTTPDLVQEFKVETNNFAAEYGRAAGGVFNVVTRSGTNEFHGNLYEFFRNDKLNASDFFANRGGIVRPPFKFNQFGGTLGGPVWIPGVYDGKNRTFFFVSIEKVRFVQGVTFVGTLPKPQELGGDFSNTRNAAGNPITIYDPASTTPAGTGFTRTVFPGNVIPAARFNPVTRAIAKYLPAPNQAGAAFTGVGNFVRTDGNKTNKDTGSYKVDHYFSEKNRFFARYSADDTPLVRAAAYGVENVASPSAGPQTFGRRNAVVQDTHTVSPTLLATVRYSFTRLGNFRRPFSDGFDITQLGIPASLASQFTPAFPYIGITGMSITGSVPNTLTGGVLGATDVIVLGNNQHALQATATKVMSNHEFKAGGEFRVVQMNLLQTGANAPQFNFTPAWTQGPNPAAASNTAGYGLATFLLGVPTGNVALVPALAMTTKYFAGFVQDSFKVTPRLTLNYGVRWDYETPRTDRFNQLTNFDANAQPPLTAPGLNLHGGLIFTGVNGVPRNQASSDWNNFAPRLGFAWKADDKTVIRGGGGLFYGNQWGVGTGSGNFGSSGFSATSTIVTSLDGVTPIVNMNNPYPNGLVRPSGSSAGLATLLGQPISFYDRDNRNPYSTQWNLTIQRQLSTNAMMEAGYTGSRGVKWPLDWEFNQLPDSYLALGNDLRTQVANPFGKQIASGILSSATVAKAQLLRPYPQYDTVQSLKANVANSSYHALEVKVERHTDSLTLLGSYTYSKNIDLGIGVFAGETIAAGVIQNFNNRKGEYAPSALDQTHRFTGNVIYELPFFKAQKGMVGRVLGGWEAGGILSLFSGSPLGISQATNTSFAQAGSQRPNWTGMSAKLDNPTVERWFDTSQFTLAAPYTFGNVARTLGGLRSASLRQLDFTLNKTTTIHERYRLQIRAECFNLTNTPQFSPPNTSLGAAGFATVSAQNNLPRIVQLAMKFLF